MVDKVVVSRKKLREMILPHINDKVVGKDGANGIVSYVHSSKMWFTAIGQAHIDEVIEMDNRLFKVERVLVDKFNAQFIGFKQNPLAKIEDAPVAEDDDTVKVIDDEQSYNGGVIPMVSGYTGAQG